MSCTTTVFAVCYRLFRVMRFQPKGTVAGLAAGKVLSGYGPFSLARVRAILVGPQHTAEYGRVRSQIRWFEGFCGCGGGCSVVIVVVVVVSRNNNVVQTQLLGGRGGTRRTVVGRRGSRLPGGVERRGGRRYRQPAAGANRGARGRGGLGFFLYEMSKDRDDVVLGESSGDCVFSKGVAALSFHVVVSGVVSSEAQGDVCFVYFCFPAFLVV
mmetsp:Transcript_9357/g.18218  ORF Transcript_9357/g.18218 Transcript_9357/m.18218 type:complete len:212 (+) Transcript_9357:2533-3168(+)